MASRNQLRRPRFGERSERERKVLTPIHEKQDLVIDPQASSVLYNGHIPAEIRTAIFDYALTEYHIPDNHSTLIPKPQSHSAAVVEAFISSTFQLASKEPVIAANQYMHNTHYTRPPLYTGRKAVSTALLRVCRRIYLETYELPLFKKEHVFWHARGPPRHSGSTLHHDGEQEHQYFRRFLPWQLVLVKEIHLFTQLFWLEDVFPRLASADFMQSIEKLQITIRRGDWWWNEHNAPLGISPQRGSGESDIMVQDWAIERAGGEVPWMDDGWGCAFKKMKNLKTLEIEFETSDDKHEELREIVKHAELWRFPAYSKDSDPEMILSAADLVPTWSSWETPSCYWSDSCPYCDARASCKVTDPPNKGCIDRMGRKKKGVGPLCHIAIVKWKLGKKDDRA